MESAPSHESQQELFDDYVASKSPDSPPHVVSKLEAMFYYSGISPTPPTLVYRTGNLKTPWVMPSGPEAYRRLKQARGVFRHKLNTVWRTVGPMVRDLLKSQRVAWTSVDVVRFITNGQNDEEDYEDILGPVVIWVGVYPNSLEGVDAFHSANEILQLLEGFDIDDVEVEYRESIYRRSVGPALLRPVSEFDGIVDICSPLTPALGLSISSSDRPDVQGTMALYFSEGGDSKNVLGLTCRHVLFETDGTANEEYVYSSDDIPRKDVQLLGNPAFDDLLHSVKLRISLHAIQTEIYEKQIDHLQATAAGGDEEDVEEANKEAMRIQRLLADTNEAIEDLERFYEKVKNDWGRASQRIIGHIRYSPAISHNVGPEGLTEDWAAFELDRSKFKDAFKGNFVNLGTEMKPNTFTMKMLPRDYTQRTAFEYPHNRLLPLRDIIPEDRLLEPNAFDDDDEPCSFVIKNGTATGVTIGRTTGMFSFVRDHLTGEESTQWAIYNYDHESDVFSAPGDSGAVIVNGLGHIGGVLTGGTGKTGYEDVTYGTPMSWLWPRIKEKFPDAHLFPTAMDE